MTIFCDRDNRWYLGVLCGLLLLALGLGAIFSWRLGQSAQEVLVAREETVAAVLLAEGVPETTVAKAFAEENGHSAAAAALLEKIGHDAATSPLLFPALRDQMERACAVVLIGTLCIGALAIAAAIESHHQKIWQRTILLVLPLYLIMLSKMQSNYQE